MKDNLTCARLFCAALISRVGERCRKVLEFDWMLAQQMTLIHTMICYF